MTTTTLCYIENDDKYLMLHRIKKQNDMNGGKWIGVGGHVESQETPEECLMREVKQETGLTLTSYKFRGLVTFVNNEYESELMCVFTAIRTPIIIAACKIILRKIVLIQGPISSGTSSILYPTTIRIIGVIAVVRMLSALR